MKKHNEVSNTRVLQPVWDRTTRWFHWINVLCVLVLSAIGTAILYEDALGFSHEGIILLKTVHVYTGYVFTMNLLWRLGWAMRTLAGKPYCPFDPAIFRSYAYT
jgi:Ni/Fe-hydrogenase 1 B-type cytochrome subunit